MYLFIFSWRYASFKLSYCSLNSQIRSFCKKHANLFLILNSSIFLNLADPPGSRILTPKVNVIGLNMLTSFEKALGNIEEEKKKVKEITSELKEKTKTHIIGRDKTKMATAEILCKIEEIPGIGKAILNRFRYLGEFISIIKHYIVKIILLAPCYPFSLS